MDTHYKRLAEGFLMNKHNIWLRKQAYSNILKISPPKTESFPIKILIFFSYICSKQRLWYSLESPHQVDSNEYSQSMFLSRNKKNNVYPSKPQFYYIKVEFMGVKIIWACFRDVISCSDKKNNHIFIKLIRNLIWRCILLLLIISITHRESAWTRSNFILVVESFIYTGMSLPAQGPFSQCCDSKLYCINIPAKDAKGVYSDQEMFSPHQGSNTESPAPESNALTTGLPRSTESAQMHELIWDFVFMYSKTACFRRMAQCHEKWDLMAHEVNGDQHPVGLIRAFAFR